MDSGESPAGMPVPHWRDALGARVELVRTGESSLWRRVKTDGSFSSSSDPRVVFGLGAGPKVERLRVIWPGGAVEEWEGLELGRYHGLREGEGSPASEAGPGARPSSGLED